MPLIKILINSPLTQIPLIVIGLEVNVCPLVGFVIVAAVVGGGEVIVPVIPKLFEPLRLVALAATGIRQLAANNMVINGNNSCEKTSRLNITFLY